MYSNNVMDISNGMLNYVGALLEASNLPERLTKQTINATMVKEVLKLSEKEDKTYDTFIAKPLFVSTAILIQARIEELQKECETLPNDFKPFMQQQIGSYASILTGLNNIIKNIDSNTKEEQ